MLALLSDPGRPTYLAIIDMPGTAIRFIRHRWPYDLAISWLNHTARIFTVYAWRLGCPAPPKTRLSARWLDFGRVGLAPTGFQLQVSRGIGSSIPLNQALPGATDIRGLFTARPVFIAELPLSKCGSSVNLIP
jgi:hypothetical protein